MKLQKSDGKINSFNVSHPEAYGTNEKLMELKHSMHLYCVWATEQTNYNCFPHHSSQ